MKSIAIKVARIGNSRGIRIPAATLARYRIGHELLMEERSDGILLRPRGLAKAKLSWDATAQAMATEQENWVEWDGRRRTRIRRVVRGTTSSSVRAHDHVRGRSKTGPMSQEEMKRYEIRRASLDPTTGGEMAKTRPVVIVSLDVLNVRLSTVTVCPLTSTVHPTWRTRVAVRVAGREAEIAVDQIRTISKTRLGKEARDPDTKDASSLGRLITEM